MTRRAPDCVLQRRRRGNLLATCKNKYCSVTGAYRRPAPWIHACVRSSGAGGAAANCSLLNAAPPCAARVIAGAVAATDSGFSVFRLEELVDKWPVGFTAKNEQYSSGEVPRLKPGQDVNGHAVTLPGDVDVDSLSFSPCVPNVSNRSSGFVPAPRALMRNVARATFGAADRLTA